MMIQAASKGDHNAVHTIIQSSAAGLRLKKTMSQALVTAASNGHVLVLRELLGAGCELNEYYEGKTALLTAAESGHERTVKELHIAGADLEANVVLDDGKMNKSTALILAAAHNHKKVVQYLVNSGANTEARNIGKETAIIVASKQGSEDVVKYLCSKDVNLEATDNRHKSAVMKAIQQNNVTIVKCLHAAGADIFLNRAQQTSLIISAIRKGHFEIITYLTSKWDKAFFSETDHRGRTPLLYAISLGSFEMVDCLISAGAKINASYMTRHCGGGTPLTEAIVHRNVDMFEMLLRRDAKLDYHLAYAFYRRQQCRQPGHWWCRHDTCEDSVQFLIAAGSQVENVTHYFHGQTRPKTTEVINEFAGLVPEIKEDSLQSRCRYRIRRQIRKFRHVPMYRSVKKLGLPEVMQKYLLFNVDVEKILSK